MTPPRGQGGRFLRITTAADPRKSMRQYDELRRNGQVERAMVLADLKDGSLQVLGQGISLDEMAAMLLQAAHGLTEAAKRHPEATRAGAAGAAPPPPPPPEPKLGTGYAGVPGGVMNGLWRGFAEHLLADAGEVQRQEMRRAFYAGAQGLLGAVMGFLEPGPDTEPTEADMAKMDALRDELAAFGKAVMEGKA